jgi:hypothetical protein
MSHSFVAGDVFLRPPEEIDQESEDDVVPAYFSEEYTSVYKKYMVSRKMSSFMGRQERVLAIDGDYIYIMPPENRNIFDSVKTVCVMLGGTYTDISSTN